MSKYPLIHQKLLHDGDLNAENFFEPHPISEDPIYAVHDDGYIAKLKANELSRKEEREIGFPFSERLLEREINIMNGSLQAALAAFENGAALNIAGGTHHAFKQRGEGFCIFNDIAIGAQYLLDHKGLERILVVDLDVHQGNGTTAIFRDDKRVFTFSMHGEKNYPIRKEVSDLDVGLPNGISDAAYLDLLDEHLHRLMHDFKPQFVFFQSGVDILETDKLGKLAVTLNGCEERDRLLIQSCFEHQVPVCAVMGGGYSEDIGIIVEAHCQTFRLMNRIWYNS